MVLYFGTTGTVNGHARCVFVMFGLVSGQPICAWREDNRGVHVMPENIVKAHPYVQHNIIRVPIKQFNEFCKLPSPAICAA